MVIAALLCVWTTWVGAMTHPRVRVRHWDVSWVGLDLAEAAILLALAVLVVRRSRVASPIAAAGATLLLFDAWFDVLTAPAGGRWHIALAMALVIEIPSAFALAFLAWRSLRW